MKRYINKFMTDQSGAITVDWVVLTAVVLGVLFGALTTFQTGVVNHAELTSTTMDSQGIGTY